MAEILLRRIVTWYYRCETLDVVPAIPKIVSIIQDAGGVFLYASRTQANPNPLTYEGDIDLIPLYIEHPLLHHDKHTSPDREWGSARLSFFRQGKILILSQVIPETNDINIIDVLAQGQLALAQQLYPYLQPVYGYIDEDGQNMPNTKDVADTRVKSILWANIFGPAYVESLGREFLLNAPSFITKELSDGGILCVVSTSLFDKEEKTTKRTIESYFRTRIPRVRLYQPK